MRSEYSFKKAKRNPYVKRLTKQVTIRLFKSMAEELDVPYQTLINLYLRDCAATKKRRSMKWTPPA